MPAGGRRSKPSPRFFTIGGTWFRGPPGRGAGVNTGVPWQRAILAVGVPARLHLHNNWVEVSGPLPARHRSRLGDHPLWQRFGASPASAGEAVSAY